MSIALKARRLASERDELSELADDPVWQAVLNAPIADREETEEERLAVEAALRGPFFPGHVVSAEIATRCRRGE